MLSDDFEEEVGLFLSFSFPLPLGGYKFTFVLSGTQDPSLAALSPLVHLTRLRVNQVFAISDYCLTQGLSLSVCRCCIRSACTQKLYFVCICVCVCVCKRVLRCGPAGVFSLQSLVCLELCFHPFGQPISSSALAQISALQRLERLHLTHVFPSRELRSTCRIPYASVFVWSSSLSFSLSVCVLFRLL